MWRRFNGVWTVVTQALLGKRTIVLLTKKYSKKVINNHEKLIYNPHEKHNPVRYFLYFISYRFSQSLRGYCLAMWEIFQSLRSQLVPTISRDSVLCFVIDDSIAELLKWNRHSHEDKQESSDVVLDLTISSSNSMIFAETKATHVAFWVSHIDQGVVDQMASTLTNSMCTQCFLVGHFTSASLKVAFPSVAGSVEEYIASRLAPVNISYHFLSDFSYSLLSTGSLQSQLNFDCRLITNHTDRLVQPLMLNSMKDASSSTAEEYKWYHYLP